MKLKKILITFILVIIILVSSTSYADDKVDPAIKVDENALSKMADKVDENTIITDDVSSTPKGDLRDIQENDKKQSEEIPKIKENAEATKNTDTPEKLEKSEGVKADKEKAEDKQESEKVLEKKESDKKAGKNTEEFKEKTDTNDVSLDKINQKSIQKVEQKNNSIIPKIESMDRLENLQKDESDLKVYIQDEKSNTGTLQKLTSKETFISAFKDKGSNLRLNLASDSEENVKNDNSKLNYMIRPQTLIILIAILVSILSAIFIAIRGNKIKNNL